MTVSKSHDMSNEPLSERGAATPVPEVRTDDVGCVPRSESGVSKPQKPRLPWVLLWLDAIDDHPNVWAFGVGTGAVMGFVMGLAW